MAGKGAEFEDRFGNSYTLTSERWKHILVRHPEMKHHRQKIAETLANPDLRTASMKSKEVWLYQRRYPKLGTIVIVVSHTKRRFLVTSYLSEGYKRGEVLWQKK